MNFYIPIVLPPWSLDKVLLRSYFWWELDNEGGEEAPFDFFLKKSNHLQNNGPISHPEI